jgi:hypothetical protein
MHLLLLVLLGMCLIIFILLVILRTIVYPTFCCDDLIANGAGIKDEKNNDERVVKIALWIMGP